MVEGSHLGGPFVWAKGATPSVSRGRTEFLFNFLPFLAVIQEMIFATIVALHTLPPSPFDIFST